ncbi:hypothetical protein CDS [Bradyrhizobium sp.]|nr:hypothetical protein CDS [Bradyrhizobium sp.]
MLHERFPGPSCIRSLASEVLHRKIEGSSSMVGCTAKSFGRRAP